MAKRLAHGNLFVRVFRDDYGFARFTVKIGGAYIAKDVSASSMKEAKEQADIHAKRSTRGKMLVLKGETVKAPSGAVWTVPYDTWLPKNMRFIRTKSD